MIPGQGSMMLGDGGRRLTYRSLAATPSGTTLSKPAGVAVGDFVVVATSASNNTSQTVATTGGSAWTAILNTDWNSDGGGGNYSHTSIYCKVMDATDIANAWTVSAAGSNPVALCWSGGEGAAVASRSTAGFTPQGTMRDVIALLFPDTTVSHAVWNPPAGWTELYDANYVSAEENAVYSGGAFSPTGGNASSLKYLLEVY